MIGLYEALGDVLALTAQRDEGRRAFDDALKRMSNGRTAERARLLRKVGITWGSQHCHDEALRCYIEAKKALGSDGPTSSKSHRDEWIQIHLDEQWVHYYMNQLQKMEVVINAIRPLIESHATPTQRARFFQTQLLLHFRRDRYFISEETLGFALASVRACKDGQDPAELPAAQLAYGLALLCHGSICAAEPELQCCLELAKRGGDNALQARCLSYLTLCARMRRNIDDTRKYSQQTAIIALTAGMLEYVGAALANESWIMLREGNLSATIARGRLALQNWSSQVFPFQWMALIPLIEADQLLGKSAEMIDYAREVLSPSQQILPGIAADAFGRAVSAWDQGNVSLANSSISLALRELSQTRFG